MQVMAAENELNNLQTTLNRWESLRDAKSISQRQRWETESLFQSTQNLRDNRKRTLETIGLTPQQIAGLITDRKILHYLPVRTTIDGFVVHFQGVLGQFFSAGETIMVIHDPNQARIRGFVSEGELTQLKIGQAARIRLIADPDFVANATVVRSDQGLDSVNGTLSIWLEFTDRPTMILQHNMLARIQLISGQGVPTLAASFESVVKEADSEYVFVKTADGRFERRLIETGRSDDRYVEIKSGLAAGETIATWGVPELQSAYAALR